MARVNMPSSLLAGAFRFTHGTVLAPHIHMCPSVGHHLVPHTPAWSRVVRVHQAIYPSGTMYTSWVKTPRPFPLPHDTVFPAAASIIIMTSHASSSWVMINHQHHSTVAGGQRQSWSTHHMCSVTLRSPIHRARHPHSPCWEDASLSSSLSTIVHASSVRDHHVLTTTHHVSTCCSGLASWCGSNPLSNQFRSK
jgi:hypothetical protein